LNFHSYFSHLKICHLKKGTLRCRRSRGVVPLITDACTPILGDSKFVDLFKTVRTYNYKANYASTIDYKTEAKLIEVMGIIKTIRQKIHQVR